MDNKDCRAGFTAVFQRPFGPRSNYIFEFPLSNLHLITCCSYLLLENKLEPDPRSLPTGTMSLSLAASPSHAFRAVASHTAAKEVGDA